MQALALGREPECVDRFRLEPRGDDEADDRRDEGGDGHGIALRHLEEEEDRRERRVGRGREERTESDERVRAPRPGEARQQERRNGPEAPPGHRTDEEDGTEDAAGCPAAEREAAAHDLRRRQRRHQRPREVPRERLVDHVVAVRSVGGGHDVENPHRRQPAEQDHPTRNRQATEMAGDRMEQTRIERGEEAEHDAEERVAEALPVALDHEGRHGEDGGIAEEPTRSDHRGRGGDHDQAQVGELHLAEQHDLLGEHERAERGIEGGGDAGGRPARDQDLPLLGRQPGEEGDGAPDRASDLRDRPLPADGSPRAEGDRRAERLHHHPPPLHSCALQVQHLEEAREAVAEHLAREHPIEREEHEAAGDEGKRNAGPTEGRRETLEEPRRARNRGPEDDVAGRPEEAGHDGERHQPRILALHADDAREARRRWHGQDGPGGRGVPPLTARRPQGERAPSPPAYPQPSSAHRSGREHHGPPAGRRPGVGRPHLGHAAIFAARQSALGAALVGELKPRRASWRPSDTTPNRSA